MVRPSALTANTDDEACPVCKSSRYLNPKMVLLVSPCYHRLCETCINRLFLHGSAPCPLCGTTLRKGNFVLPTFEDLRVEKELRIRKIVSKTFYKRQEDFETLTDYNDYLEEVEEIVFNLVSDVDVQATYVRLEAFKSENREVLERSLARLANEQRQEQAAHAQADRQLEEARKRAAAQLETEQASVVENRQNLIDELATSDAPAAVILAENQKKRTKNEKSASTVNSIKLPSMKGLRSKHMASAVGLDPGVLDSFDPLRNLRPLSAPVLPFPDSCVPDDGFLRDLLEDYWPKAPTAIKTRQGSWNLGVQMRAAGYSVEIVRKHCLRAALSWGL